MLEELWGVVDIVPQTNFRESLLVLYHLFFTILLTAQADIRCRCVIQNGSDTMMIIPREQHMVRFYVPLGDMQHKPRLQVADQFGFIVARIRKILAPYWLDFDICDWWSSYRIKQQIATHFSGSLNRVFLAGDAIHTHSPKAGQGLNVSIQDAWNIGWKLAAVVKNQATQAILESYEIERRPVAQRLLSFDKKMLQCFRSLCKEANEHEIVPASNSLDQAVTEEHSTASGIEVSYNGLGLQSVSTAPSNPDMATGVELGCRFGEFNVLRHADGYVGSLHHVLPANGHWRVIVFPGDIAQSKQKARLELLGEKLAHLKLLPRFLTLGILAEYEAILIHAASRDQIELMDLPGVFRPWCPWGLDADRIFADYPTYHHDQHFPVYQRLGISKDAGCLVILRPDQHVSFVGKLDVLLQDVPVSL